MSVRVACKVCTDPTHMLGTRLCNKCWNAVHSMESMIRSLKCSVQITFEHDEWCVHTLGGEYNPWGRGETLFDALTSVGAIPC